MSRIDDIRTLCATHTEKDALLGHIKYLLSEIDKRDEEIDRQDTSETIRRNRQHASGWVKYWREKAGRDDNWYPDWDMVFKDWEDRGKVIEKLKNVSSEQLLLFNEAMKDIPRNCDTCAWLEESEGYCEVECPHCDVCLKPNMAGSCYCSASEWKWRGDEMKIGE